MVNEDGGLAHMPCQKHTTQYEPFDGVTYRFCALTFYAL
jgi:hypothetical protein